MLAHMVRTLAVVAITMLPLPTLADDHNKQRTVTVSASGYVTAEPDFARLTVGVVTEASSAKDALERNSKLFSRVLSGVKRLGIDAKDIATDRFQVNPIYGRRKADGRNVNRIDGYRVRNTASVTVRNISQTGSVIDRATEFGANSIGSIDFVISDLETKLDRAREAAMRNAIRRAKLYARAAGARLDNVLTISEQFHGGHRRPMRMQRRASMSAAAPIEPGQQKIGVTVNVVWKLQ